MSPKPASIAQQNILFVCANPEIADLSSSGLKKSGHKINYAESYKAAMAAINSGDKPSIIVMEPVTENMRFKNTSESRMESAAEDKKQVMEILGLAAKNNVRVIIFSTTPKRDQSEIDISNYYDRNMIDILSDGYIEVGSSSMFQELKIGVARIALDQAAAVSPV